MKSHALRSLGIVALSVQLSAGCSLFGGNRNTTNAHASALGNVHTYTDSDVVTGVTTTPDAIFVATLRGVIKYPAAGGEPRRMTTEQGLPDNQVYAVSSAGVTEVWAATAHGVARWMADHWATVGEGQPDVGRPTAILAIEGGQALLGGAQGIARFDGQHWSMLTNQYQVTAFAMDSGRPIVATANSGVLAIRGDFSALDEYGPNSGVPETLVRSLVPAGAGKFWALVQGTEGSKLAYWNGHQWFGYTSEHIRDPWLALVNHNGAPALVMRGALYDILERRGDELIPTEVSANTDGQRRVTLQPEVVAPPPPPPPPASPEPSSPPPGRGRGRGRSAAPTHAPAGRGHHDVVHAAMDAQTASAAPTRTRTTASASPAPTAASASSAPSAAPAAASSAPVASAPAISRPPPRPPAIRPRNIPAYAGPVEVPHGGPTLDAPTYGLERVRSITLPDDAVTTWSEPTGLYIWRSGLGVSRIAGGEATNFRAHDLAFEHRPLSLATDTNNAVWLVTEDGSPVRYDGTRFSHVVLDNDEHVVPLMFWSRGTVAAAVGRVGPNVIRTYRWSGNGWRQVTERPIDTAGPGTIDVKFFAVDEHQRFWVGLRVNNNGTIREHGVAVLDDSQPAATQFNSHVAPTGAVQGAVPSPDDFTAVEFDESGTAWFAGLSGATSIALPSAPDQPSTVHTYNEANGLRGDLVSDLARGPQNRIYIATTEGIGFHDGNTWSFDIVGSSTVPRVIALAVDVNGSQWGAGQRGAWVYDGTHFRAVGRNDGLPNDSLTDVQVDGENRVWFVSADGITVLTQPRAASGSGS